jgi:hypothetical protein
MSDCESRLRQLAALETLRNQQHNLEETIGRLVMLMKTLPEGDARDSLLLISSSVSGHWYCKTADFANSGGNAMSTYI